MTLLLPDPTEREIKRQIRERSEEALRALDDARRRAPFLQKWRHFPKGSSGARDVWDVRRIAMEEWRRFLDQLHVERLGYGDIRVTTVMDWYDACSAPFGDGKKRKEFPDAFALAILGAYAAKHGKHIAVVSDDRDFKNACERFSALLYFPSLPRLTEALLADPTLVATLREAVMADMSDIEAKVWEAADNLVFYHCEDRYELERSRVTGTSVHEISIVAVGDGQCTLTFEADIQSEHRLTWSKRTDSYAIDHERQEESIAHDASVTGTAKVEVDLVLGRVIRVISLEIDDSEVEITTSPGGHDW